MEKPPIPTFSQKEKERRWGLVRGEMRKASLDALICLPNQGHWDQFGADARYLTQIGGFQTEVAVVFPLEGEVTAVVRGPNEVENHLIGELLREVVKQGGEPISMLFFGAGGPEVPWAQRVVTARPLKAGDLINTELEGKYGGYIAQALQPISLGPGPKELERMFDTTRVIFDKMLKLLEPGTTFGEVVAFYQDEVRAAGYEPGEALMHGRGLGEGASMLWGAVRDFPESGEKLKEGHVFILKPAAKKGEMRDSIRAGDTVVIETNGARRLGKRDLAFVQSPHA